MVLSTAKYRGMIASSTLVGYDVSISGPELIVQIGSTISSRVRLDTVLCTHWHKILPRNVGLEL